MIVLSREEQGVKRLSLAGKTRWLRPQKKKGHDIGGALSGAQDSRRSHSSPLRSNTSDTMTNHQLFVALMNENGLTR